MRQRRPLYRCIAGVEPNNLLQSDPGSEKRLWRNLPSSPGIPRVSINTTLTRVSDFMSFDATETSFISLRSWGRAQHYPAIRSRIGAVVVEESAIEFLDRQHPTPNFMNNSPLGMNLIPLDSWHRAQEPPCVGFRIGCMAVVECCSCGPGVWMLDQWPRTRSASAKNILPHVLHTYLPVSPGNTISPYTPHASHFSVLF